MWTNVLGREFASKRMRFPRRLGRESDCLAGMASETQKRRRTDDGRYIPAWADGIDTEPVREYFVLSPCCCGLRTCPVTGGSVASRGAAARADVPAQQAARHQLWPPHHSAHTSSSLRMVGGTPAAAAAAQQSPHTPFGMSVVAPHGLVTNNFTAPPVSVTSSSNSKSGHQIMNSSGAWSSQVPRTVTFTALPSRAQMRNPAAARLSAQNPQTASQQVLPTSSNVRSC